MKKIKSAVIGFGRIGRSHAVSMINLPELFELKTICDHDASRFDVMPKEIKDTVKRCAELDELLADPEIELISIATRHLDHVPMAIRVLNAGKAAVVEKPVACSEKIMAELKKAADQHPGKLFLRHNRRFEPAFMKAMELVNNGTLGTAHYFRLCRGRNFSRRNDWMTMTEFFGGMLTNWGPHVIDQALQFLGSPVAEQWSDVRRSIGVGDGDDMFKIVLKGTNGRVVEAEVYGAHALPGRELEIVGSRGALTYENGDRFVKVRIVDPAQAYNMELKPNPGNPPLKYGNQQEILRFIEVRYEIPDNEAAINSVFWTAVADGFNGTKEYPISFEQALEVVKVTRKAFEQSHFEPMLEKGFFA